MRILPRYVMGAVACAALVALPGGGPEARAAGLQAGRSQVVVYTPASRYPVRGDRGAALNLVYWAPLRNAATKQVLPLLHQILARFRGKVRLQLMSRYRQGTYYVSERYAALVGREAFAQGGDRLFWRYYDALCALPSLYTLTNTSVDQVARTVGLNLQRLQTALARHLHDKAVREENDLATEIGVPIYNSSPVLLIGDERYYISQWTRLPYVEAIIRRQLQQAARWQGQGLSVGQIHDKYFAQARKRYPPWRRYGSRRPTPSLRQRTGRRYAIPVDQSPAKGPSGAWITVVAFLDFTDHNSYNAWVSLQGLLTRYPKQLRVVWKAMPRRYYSNALGAARAAYAARAQGKFWELAQVFFQNRWRLYPAQLPTYARQAGLDVLRFQRDSRDPKMSQAVLNDMQLARKVGVSASPGIFVNGRRMLSRYYNHAELEKLIRQELRGGLLTRLFGR